MTELCVESMLQVHSKAITIPGRALAGVIAELKAAMPESHQLLDSFHQDVVACLKAMSANDAQNNNTNELQTRLEGKLEDLKALALSSKSGID